MPRFEFYRNIHEWSVGFASTYSSLGHVRYTYIQLGWWTFAIIT